MKDSNDGGRPPPSMVSMIYLALALKGSCKALQKLLYEALEGLAQGPGKPHVAIHPCSQVEIEVNSGVVRIGEPENRAKLLKLSWWSTFEDWWKYKIESDAQLDESEKLLRHPIARALVLHRSCLNLA